MLEPQVSIKFDSEDRTGGTFMIEGETHTLGNALRETINPNPNVQFCGYAVPHPAEQKMTLRIQTKSPEQDIIEVMNTGLGDFQQWCDQTKDRFHNAFHQANPDFEY